jgi:hypothetical protein
MKPWFLKSGMLAAILGPLVILGGTSAWAACPTSPYYSPDFSVNGTNCLALNGNAGILAPAGGPATITGYSAGGGTVTFTAANSFVPGEPVILSGFANSTFLNTLVFPVVTASSTQFTVAYTPTSGSSDTGTATPLYLLQLTANTGGQVGSAWDTTPQPVAKAFSTTFAFQLNSAGLNPGDGIAFVIQNSSTTAIADGGCSIGFAGDPDYGFCGGVTDGIAKSVAIAFKTYADGTQYPAQNSVSIESERTGANCIDKVGCTLAENDLTNGPTLADGKIHAVTITYTLTPTAAQTNCIGNAGPDPCLDVILDGTDLFPTGVAFNMASIGLSSGNTAWVGFTGATGAASEANNILSWVFTPAGGSQTGNVSTSGTTNFNSGGGFQPGNDTTSGYNFNAQLTSGNPVSAVVTTIPIKDQATCNALVQANPSYSSAECFVYQNGGGQGVDVPVMFELTCPPAGECDSGSGTFPATLGSEFAFVYGENSPLTLNNFPPNSLSPVSGTTGVTGLPAVGLLKGQGPDPIHPCTPYPNNTPPLFQSNQISNFVFNADTSGSAHGSSGDTNSCWIATYNTAGELPTVNITAPSGNYPVGGSLPAAYTCTAVNNSAVNNGVVGPYLTVPNGSCTGPSTFDTSTLGAHTYTATVTDSALNTNYETVTYYVQQAPAITSASTAYFTSGSLGSFGVTTTGYPVPKLTAGTGLPSWATLTDNGDGTATLSGTPPSGAGGSYSFNITAANTVNPNYVQAFTLVVDQNLAITSANSTSFTGGVAGSFKVTTTGYPVATSIGQTGAPGWVTLTNNNDGTATLGGTPPLNLGATSFPITITAQNGVSPNATQSFTLNVNAGTEQVSFSTSPTGRAFTVDSMNYTGTANLTWTIGSQHTISVTGPQISGGTEYTFNNWSDAGAVSHQVTTTTTTTSYTASFNTLYQLTTAASPTNGGTVTPASGTYYASGAVVPVAAVANAGFKFTNWTGPVATASSASTTVTMSAPETVTANFSSTPALTIFPTSLNFANQNNNTNASQTVTLTNAGSSTITISSVRIPGSNSETMSPGDPDDFSFANHCGSSIAAGKSCTIVVTFSADNDDINPYASLVITDNVTGSPQSVPITANILDPLISLSSNSLSFGSVTHATTSAKTVTVKNTGLTALTLSGLSISGTGFAFTSPAPAGSCTSTTTLSPGATCVVGVTFSPAAAKVSYSGTVTITSNSLDGTKKISLSGTGK